MAGLPCRDEWNLASTVSVPILISYYGQEKEERKVKCHPGLKDAARISAKCSGAV